MELVKHRIPVKRGQTITILPIGDIQWAGDPNEVAVGLLQEAIEYGRQTNAYYIGMGDYTDVLSPSNRERLASANLYDTARGFLDRSASGLVKEVYEKFLKPTKGKWLGMLEGHHYFKYEAGNTSDQELCQLLEARHIGSCAYIGLSFVEGDRNLGTVNVWCHHGAGGGISAASPIQKLESYVYGEWEADIYLMGHMTKISSTPKNRCYPIWDGIPHLSHRKKILCGTGGFSKAYVEGSRQGQVPRGGYVEKRLMKPVVLGCPIIRIVPRLEMREHGLRTWSPKISAET